MKAMILRKIVKLDEDRAPLELAEIPEPVPGEKELLVKVSACGVCHTELDEIEGRMRPPGLPVVPGHQAVGRVVGQGPKARAFKEGERVGVAWIYSACGRCGDCRGGNENLCPEFRATGRDVDGGYAELMKVPEEFAHRIPGLFSDLEAAPLLCAGAIGYRSLRLTNIREGEPLGLVGFGASAHLVLQMARHRHPTSPVFVFARSERERAFAEELGAAWTGDIGERPPEKLAASIDTTPVWRSIVEAMGNLRPGGRLVINAIRKEDVDKETLSRLDYSDHLWMEKEIKSVTNVSRSDVREFLGLAAEIPIRPEIQEYPLEGANEALLELKDRKIRGAKVLRIGS